MDGTVRHYNEQRGIGTILGDNGKYYFVHYTKIVGRQYKILYKDENVSFDPVPVAEEGKNDKAINVKPIQLGDFEKTIIEENPFIPGRPVQNPKEFAGRRQSIIECARSLANHQSILITGSRGIGKSSLANQVLSICQGNSELLKKFKIQFDHKFKYHPITIRISKDSTLGDLSLKVIDEYYKKYNLESSVKLDHEIDLKFYKAKIYERQDKAYEREIIDLFNYDIIKIHDALGGADGLIIFIDELEHVLPDSGLANFVKNVTEYFVSNDRKITFVFSGIPSATTKLFIEHKSFLRIFNHVEIDVLSPVESDELINLFLKNKRKTVSAIAIQFICSTARGYPYHLQLLGSVSYQLNDNFRISKKDVNDSIDYIIKYKKKKEYEAKHESIGYGIEERILEYLYTCSFNDEITFNKIRSSLKINSEELVKAFNFLEENEILAKKNKGVYYIKDVLFHYYLKSVYKNQIKIVK